MEAVSYVNHANSALAISLVEMRHLINQCLILSHKSPYHPSLLALRVALLYLIRIRVSLSVDLNIVINFVL